MGCSLCRNDVEIEIILKPDEKVEEKIIANQTSESSLNQLSPQNSFVSSLHEPQAYYAVHVLTEVRSAINYVENSPKTQMRILRRSFRINELIIQATLATYFIINDQLYYTGFWKQGLQNGFGRQLKMNEFLYEGYFMDGQYEGQGTLINKVGDIYIGQFEKGKANGEGTLTYSSKKIYKGNWKLDKYDGFGKEEFPDGAYYEGDYQDGLRHGEHCIYVWADGSKYLGSFQNNNFEGEGTLQWGDGRMYSGSWHNGKMHGKGVYTWADGKQYVGEFHEGVREGRGVLIAKSRKISGIFKNGKMHTLQHNDGTMSEFERNSSSVFDLGLVLQKSSVTDDKESLQVK